MEETINIFELFTILKKRLLLIIVFALLGTGIAGGVIFFVLTPRYQAAAELIVQTKNDGNTGSNLQSDVSANIMMINTYKDMIKGKMILSRVQENLASRYQYDISVDQLRSMIQVSQSQNSQVFQIQATSINPTQAADVANVTAEIFQKSVLKAIDVNKVTITSEAEIPTNSIYPKNNLNLAIGFVLGTVLGVACSLLLALLDKTIKDERFILEEAELPILGVISEVSKKEIINGKAVVFELKGNKDPLDEFMKRSEPRV